MAAPPPTPGLGGPLPSSLNSGWALPRSDYDLSKDNRSARDEEYFDPYYRNSNPNKHQDVSSESNYEDYYQPPYYNERQSGDTAPGGYYKDESNAHSSSRSYEPAPAPAPAPPPPSRPANVPQEVLDPLDPLRPNDVEIVVPNKMQRSYAETIENHLKRMNLLVDLLFPPPDISAGRVIRDLNARRCLYAIFATPENEKHNSLTLNILHGDPQEHRNMPFDDALRLIQRDFEDYVKQTRLRNMRDVVPRDVRNLLVDLLEMRPLSMGDLDKLIKYLRERQNRLVDDQIEQKREIAGNHSSVVPEGMAVSYPGYNYMASTMPGTNQATMGTAQGLISGSVASPSIGQQSASVNLVSSPNAAAAAAAAAAAVNAYPASAYGGMSSTGIITAYGMSQPLAAQVTHPGQTSHHIQGHHPSDASSKQAELQERIMSLMKNQSDMSVAGGVPPPVAVPPPSVVPGSRMIIQPHTMWMSQHHSENNGKVHDGGQASYNPWNQ